MRFCLACRRLSANTPRCTNCGRSFGGRLCTYRRCGHLNPSVAQVCGQCGSVSAGLADPAASVPLSGIAALGAALAGAIWGLPPALRWLGQATGYSHYRDGRVWFIETTAGLLMPFFIIFALIYALSHMVPGEGGKLMRNALVGTTMWAVRGLLSTVKGIGKGLSRIVASGTSRTRIRR